MTLKERMNLWFHKDECIQVLLYDNKMNARIHIKRIGYNAKTIDMGEESYAIDPKKIYRMNGLPTLSYHISNTVPIDPQLAKSEDYTSQTMNKIFKTKIVSELIDTSEDEGISLKSIIMVTGAVVVVLIGIGLYMLYQEISAINDYIDQNKDVIELIKDYLLQNGGR